MREGVLVDRQSRIEDLRAAFQWDVPARFNIGAAICDAPAAVDPDGLAIIDVPEEGEAGHWTAGTLRSLADRVGHGLRRLIVPGDRVGVLLPQRVETAAAQIAILKCGAISMPLFTLFGPDALALRLKDSGTTVVVTDGEGVTALAALRRSLPRN